MPAERTSVYLAADLAAAVKASGQPLAELVRRGLAVGTVEPVRPATAPGPASPSLAALRALQSGLLPCASSEQAILRIAASLGDPAIPVRLRTVLGNLDTRTITLVAAAITTANG